jgi:hypothetical protein
VSGGGATRKQAAAMWERRVGSRTDGETVAIREESEIGDFFIFISV